MDTLVMEYGVNPDDAARIMAELEERYRYFMDIYLILLKIRYIHI